MLWCTLGSFWGCSLCVGQQPLLYQLKAESTQVSRECWRFFIVNEGSNCKIRLKPVLSGAYNRSCHKAITYSINQVFIFSTPQGREAWVWRHGEGAPVDSAEVIITALYFPTMIYILNAFTPIIPSNSPARWCDYLHVAVEN